MLLDINSGNFITFEFVDEFIVHIKIRESGLKNLTEE